MRRLMILVMAASAATFAQNSEIGATVGIGAMAAEDVTTSQALAAGAEFCGLCSGRLSVFAEYSHVERIGKRGFPGINRFDLLGGGLRIQGGRRVRPFFDVGFAYGIDSYRWQTGSNSHGNPGMVLAGGAAIRLSERMYMRPQFRVYALRGLHFVSTGTVGLGVRF